MQMCSNHAILQPLGLFSFLFQINLKWSLALLPLKMNCGLAMFGGLAYFGLVLYTGRTMV